MAPRISASSRDAAYANMASSITSRMSCAVPSLTPSPLASKNSVYQRTLMLVILCDTSTLPVSVKLNVTSTLASWPRLLVYVTACAVTDRVKKSKYRPSLRYCSRFPRLLRVAAMSRYTGNPFSYPGTFRWKNPYGVPTPSCPVVRRLPAANDVL